MKCIFFEALPLHDSLSMCFYDSLFFASAAVTESCLLLEISKYQLTNFPFASYLYTITAQLQYFMWFD